MKQKYFFHYLKDILNKFSFSVFSKYLLDYDEPGKDDGTGCQKSRETNPGTLPGTSKG